METTRTRSFYYGTALKKGRIFISEDKKVYQVQGIISSWEEMFQFAPMLLLVEATFIPFRNVIISDGLVLPYNIVIGKNTARQFKDIYMDAKKNGKFIRGSLYEAMGKKKEKRQIDKAIKAYEDYLEEYFGNMEFDEDELEYLEDDLPFH